MPALPESRIKKLGVIAGGGVLPARLLYACDRAGIEPFIVAFEGQTDPGILDGRHYMLARLGVAGTIINTLKAHEIRDLVFIGTIRRPSLTELRPDLRTIRFFAGMVTRALGDDGLLKAIKKELEAEGFHIHGVQSFVQDLIAVGGPVGRHKPSGNQQEDIARGVEALGVMGPLDIGQAIVVQEGIILGVEAIEGTDALIQRCGSLKRKGHGPILIKMSKPGQDQNLDLPTVGPDTIRFAAEHGFSGIVIEAGNSLLIDPQEVAELADRAGIFVVAIKRGTE